MSELGLLLVTAASVGWLHTLLGPDHYLPFIALSQARSWSLIRTAGVTLACGLGHVVASLALAGALAWGLAGLEWVERWRGELALWLLVGFGLAYAAWGVRDALRDRPHSHWHRHADGSLHSHRHVHRAEHAHPHAAAAPGTRLTPWVLFTVSVLGPCEPLIPLIMVPLARQAPWQLALVVTTFAFATLSGMLAAVIVGRLGIGRVGASRLGRYRHAIAGLTLAACGAALWLAA